MVALKRRSVDLGLETQNLMHKIEFGEMPTVMRKKQRRPVTKNVLMKLEVQKSNAIVEGIFDSQNRIRSISSSVILSAVRSYDFVVLGDS